MTAVTVPRRALLALAPAAAGLCALVPPAAQAEAQPGPDTWLKLVADLTGRTVYSLTEGMVWGFRPQADDLSAADFARPLYGYRSLIARKALRADGGVQLRTKGWSFYLDPVSREPIRELLNPYTQAMVACPPLSAPAASAVYGGPAATATPQALAARRIGERVWLEVDKISRFKPADTTWFKLEADFTTYQVQVADLARAEAGHIPSVWSHSLTAEWQTWMRMHGQPGHILFNGAGAALPHPEALDPGFRRAIEQAFPGSLAEVRGWG